MRKETMRLYCGIGPCRPQWLQRFKNIQTFTLFTCIVICVQGIYIGYAIGVLTTIEKRFEIPSYSSAILLSAYDFGHAICVLLMGHFGATLHKPKWIAWGNFLSAVSCFGLALPNFIFGSLSQHSLEKSGNASDLLADSYCQDSSLISLSNASGENLCVLSSNNQAYYMLAFFQCIAGIASAPSVPLTFVYVDDNCSKKKSPLYTGLVSSMWAFGPALGFGFSSICTRLHVTLQEKPSQNPENVDWIGAWWLGFVIIGACYILFGFPLLCFPYGLTQRKHEDAAAEYELQPLEVNGVNGAISNTHEPSLIKESVEDEEHSEKQPSMKELCLSFMSLPSDIWKLLGNPIFVSITVLWIGGAIVFGGFYTFLPKYFEVQFYQPTYLANINAGIIGIFGSSFSIAVGGKILSYFNPHPSKSCLLLLGAYVQAIICLLIASSIGCSNSQINGHDVTSDSVFNFTDSICDANCYCDSTQFRPVCNLDSLTYSSPCLLGCQMPLESGIANASAQLNCSCSSAVKVGYCSSKCTKSVLYTIIIFVSSFMSNLFTVATINLIMWCVPEDQKTRSIGLASLISSILGFMPSQILYGKIVDTTCLLWSGSKCDSGYCQVYDNDKLRSRLHWTTAVVMVNCVLAAAVACKVAKTFHFHISSRPKRREHKTLMKSQLEDADEYKSQLAESLPLETAVGTRVME